MPIDPSIPRCQHIKTNGVPCGSPSLRNRALCYYHYRTRQDPPRRPRKRPNLEDADAIQLGIAEVIRRIQCEDIDLRAAALLLYAYQTASANLKQTRNQPAWRDVVLDLAEVDEDEELAIEETAPEKKLPQTAAAQNGIVITEHPRTINEQDPIPLELTKEEADQRINKFMEDYRAGRYG